MRGETSLILAASPVPLRCSFKYRRIEEWRLGVFCLVVKSVIYNVPGDQAVRVLNIDNSPL